MPSLRGGGARVRRRLRRGLTDVAVDTALAPALERALALLEPEAREPERVAPGGYLDLLGADGPQSTGAVQDLMLTGPGAAHLRALVAPAARPRVQGRVRARA